MKTQNIIKKIFPEYKSKAELKQEIAFLNGLSMVPIKTVERNVDKLRVTAELMDNGIPIDAIKRMLSRDMATLLEPFIEYDIKDEMQGMPRKLLVGTLYVARK